MCELNDNLHHSTINMKWMEISRLFRIEAFGKLRKVFIFIQFSVSQNIFDTD